jgi:hypothetical protein
MGLTMQQRRALTSEVAVRYRAADKTGKKRILDEFTATTGYHRKYAITLLSREGKKRFLRISGKTLKAETRHNARSRREHPKTYDEAVRKALIRLWEGFNYQCSKLLAPFINRNIDAIADHPDFPMDDDVREKLRSISVSTVERLLVKHKKKLRIRGTCGTKSGPPLKKRVAILAYRECALQPPGFFQIDLVQHDGGNPSGEFADLRSDYTLTMTDVATGWTVHYPLRNKAHKWVKESLQDARNRFVFPFHAIHSDCGSEFINDALFLWCRDNAITFTKGRTGRKNDNCWVEQKNNSTVRKTAGYSRYSGDKTVEALRALYSPLDLLTNLFYPCMKLLSKERVGPKYRKHYDKARPPFQRLLERDDVCGECKTAILALKNSTDLLEQQALLNRAIENLERVADTFNPS